MDLTFYSIMKVKNPDDNYNVLDLDQLVENVRRIMQNVDPRVIKPESYLYSELMKKHPVETELGLDADLNKFIQRYNGKIQYFEGCRRAIDARQHQYRRHYPR